MGADAWRLDQIDCIKSYPTVDRARRKVFTSESDAGHPNQIQPDIRPNVWNETPKWMDNIIALARILNKQVAETLSFKFGFNLEHLSSESTTVTISNWYLVYMKSSKKPSEGLSSECWMNEFYSAGSSCRRYPAMSARQTVTSLWLTSFHEDRKPQYLSVSKR